MTARLAGWRMIFLGAASGALAAFGQAPYDQPLFLFAGFVAGFYFLTDILAPRRAALFGWAFGLGYFAHALQWIVSPFMVDVARHGWMAPFAVVFLAAGLALFWALAFGAARWLSPRQSWPLILTLSAAELIRAYIFTGFPWAMPAQALVDSLGGQALALIGPYALTLCILALCAVLAAPAPDAPRRVLRYGVILLGLGAVILPVMQPPAALTDHSIRLIQPNATQRDKWDPEKIPVFFDRQLSFTAAAPESTPPVLVLWPETAIPWRLDHAEPILPDITQAAGQARVALGVQRADETGYFNSMAVLGPTGEVSQVYDKHHLVPFGEYIPLAHILNRIGIFGLAQQVPEGYRAGPGLQLLDFGALGRALPLICYEAVFPHDARSSEARPDFLIQITNDAWFGRGAGPRQHLAQARMRAIEQGLPLARAANTGISAMIDPHGRITAALALNTAGFVDAPLPRALPPTLYSRTGDAPFALMLLLGLAWAGFRTPRRKPDV